MSKELLSKDERVEIARCPRCGGLPRPTLLGRTICDRCGGLDVPQPPSPTVLKQVEAISSKIVSNGDQLQYELDNASVPPEQRSDWPLPSFDATDWAVAFNKKHPSVSVDDARAWMACALMRGYDEALVRHHETSSPLDIGSAAIFFDKWLWDSQKRQSRGEPWSHAQRADVIQMLLDSGFGQRLARAELETSERCRSGLWHQGQFLHETQCTLREGHAGEHQYASDPRAAVKASERQYAGDMDENGKLR